MAEILNQFVFWWGHFLVKLISHSELCHTFLFLVFMSTRITKMH